MLLKDKILFITGGAQGFGRAAAEAVLKKGAQVCLADINEAVGRTTEKELQSAHGEDRVMFVKCDVSNQTSLEEAFNSAVTQFGHVDVMCNNAGIMDESVWEREVNINFNGVVRGTNIAIDHMRTDKGGKGGLILNTSSMAALVSTYWFPVYAATKSAIYNFTNCWAQNPELKAAGVRFTTICPQGSKTAILDLKEHQIHNLAQFRAAMENYEYYSLDQIAEAFLKAIGDDGISGGGIILTRKEGPAHVALTPGPFSSSPSPMDV